MSHDPMLHTILSELSELRKWKENMQTTDKKTQMSYDLCPYPFDMTLSMPPFPHGYVTPNFNKYKGKTNPIDHIREFVTSCADIAHEHTYLMRLFPKSLTGPALEWFYTLQPGIQSWRELASKFVKNYTYNIDTNTSITTLCQLTQEDLGETFIPFFQKWRGLASHCNIDIPEK